MIQLFHPWYSCSAHATFVLPMIQLFYPWPCIQLFHPWYSCSTHDTVVLPMIQLFYPWYSCSTHDTLVLPMIHLFYPWYSCSTHDTVVLPRPARLVVFMVLTHWNNIMNVCMSLHSEILFCFRANQSLLLLFSDACLSEKQHCLSKFIICGLIRPGFEPTIYKHSIRAN
jgi:hypothetical protein